MRSPVQARPDVVRGDDFAREALDGTMEPKRSGLAERIRASAQRGCAVSAPPMMSFWISVVPS